MSKARPIILTLIILLLSAHRLPAPISEVQETPTPAPTASVGTAAVVNEQPSLTTTPMLSGAMRFAGTWAGRINMQKIGDLDVTLIISADGTSLQQRSKLAVDRQPLPYNGASIAWRSQK